MYRLYFVLALFGGIATSAFAQITVLGSGLSADCYHAAKAGRTVGAIDICTRALMEETMTRATRAATYVNRGVLLMRSGDYDKAEEDYVLAERLDPNESAIYVNRGAALIYQRDFQSALGQLNRAIGLAGTNLDRFPPASASWLEQAQSVGNDHLHIAYYNRAIAKKRTNDLEGSYYDFLSAKRLKPEWDLVEEQLENFVVQSTYDQEVGIGQEENQSEFDNTIDNENGFTDSQDQ